MLAITSIYRCKEGLYLDYVDDQQITLIINSVKQEQMIIDDVTAAAYRRVHYFWYISIYDH